MFHSECLLENLLIKNYLLEDMILGIASTESY